MDAKAEKLALFRYGLIAPLVLEIAARQYDIPDSQRISVSVDTLLEWSLRYRRGGFDALAPKPRQDRGQSRAITPQLADLIERLKRENPHRTGMTLLRELALTSEQNEPGVSASTLYRFLKQRGLTERQLLEPAAHKKFEAQFSNQPPHSSRPVLSQPRTRCVPRLLAPSHCRPRRARAVLHR